MKTILQEHLPQAPWMSPATWRLPGLAPLPLEDWIVRDESFAEQMRLRDQLIEDKPALVHDTLPRAADAARECLELVLDTLQCDAGYGNRGEKITRPDGVEVAIDQTAPLLTLGRLFQADICLLQPGADGHELTAAILCFPSSWTLAEKMGRPLGAIHGPVETYDKVMARRVQRVFDALKPGQLLWRSNAFLHGDPRLFRPRREADSSRQITMDEAKYVRSERQAIRKLPKTDAIAFTIHTRIVARDALTSEQNQALEASGIDVSD